MEPSPSSAPENATQPQRHGDTERFAPPVESNVSAALCLCVSVVAFARCEQGSVAFDLRLSRY